MSEHWEVERDRLAEVEAAHQERFALITKHYGELAAERDELYRRLTSAEKAASEYRADAAFEEALIADEIDEQP